MTRADPTLGRPGALTARCRPGLAECLELAEVRAGPQLPARNDWRTDVTIEPRLPAKRAGRGVEGHERTAARAHIECPSTERGDGPDRCAEVVVPDDGIASERVDVAVEANRIDQIPAGGRDVQRCPGR